MLRPFEVKHLSMAPVLLPDDIAWIDPHYKLTDLSRGDIVVYMHPDYPVPMIHRVMGFSPKKFPLILKGDRNAEKDRYDDHAVYQGRALYRSRHGKLQKLRFKKWHWLLSTLKFYPGQRVPSWITRANLMSLWPWLKKKSSGSRHPH